MYCKKRQKKCPFAIIETISKLYIQCLYYKIISITYHTVLRILLYYWVSQNYRSSVLHRLKYRFLGILNQMQCRFASNFWTLSTYWLLFGSGADLGRDPDSCLTGSTRRTVCLINYSYPNLYLNLDLIAENRLRVCRGIRIQSRFITQTLLRIRWFWILKASKIKFIKTIGPMCFNDANMSLSNCFWI